MDTSPMASLPLAALLLASVALSPLVSARAQAPAAPAIPAAPEGEPDPVVARVNGEDIRLGDVMALAADQMPAELRAVPPATLRAMLPPAVFEQLLDRAVIDRVMLLAARAAGLQNDPEVRQRLRQLEESELRETLLRREVLPRLTDEALRARWERDQGARAPEEEVRARHILVASEAEARSVLQEIQRGGNFEEVARRRSTDPAARNGGDLGFFRRADMVAEFANAAFALQPGQVSPSPVRTQFGWHVIRLEERRTTRGPSFEDSRDALRQQAIEEEVTAAVQRVRAAARIEILELPAPAAAPQPEPPPAPPAPRR
jgi:peptidyl-prolyl cis-trans isomerase C